MKVALVLAIWMAAACALALILCRAARNAKATPPASPPGDVVLSDAERAAFALIEAQWRHPSSRNEWLA